MNAVPERLRGGAAIALGAGIWGLFWIPLRYLDQHGVEGPWAVALTLSAGMLIAVPLAIWKSRKSRKSRWWFSCFGTTIGLATVLYFAAVILSDVVRVVFLFYLLPIWATLLARVLYREQLRLRKLMAVCIAFLGLFMLLGGNGGLPLPQNLGDWFALVSGFLWALSLTLIRGNPELDPYVSASTPFVFGAPLALLLGFFLLHTAPASVQGLPELADVGSLLPISILFGCIVLWPSLFAQVWGARLVAAPTAALLTMTEILVATFSAWLLIGSSLTPVAILGGGLIVCAAVLDLTTPSLTSINN